jgi:membrane protease YdiL (CAAX protease family)
MQASEALPGKKAMAVLAAQACVMAALGAGLWHWSGREWADFLSLSAGEAAQGTALGLVLIALAMALFAGLPWVSEKLVRMQIETYGFLGSRLGFPAIVFISICAGVGEEALFRGGLQTILGDRLGTPAAIALSSAAFAAIHLERRVITAMLFLVGVVFGAIYSVTGSLLTVMIGHALYDVWALRYLLSEFKRLGLVGEADAASLANPADPV